MTHEEFRALEMSLAGSHAAMAELLGVSEISVKRYATGAQPIPADIARLAVALLLIADEGLQKKFSRLLAKYHADT
jgi:plasmid maintenance system antidote protein VapI